MTRTEEITAAANREHLPGDGHMWVMVLGDLVIFAGYFVIFAVHRAMNRDEFLQAQQHLAINIGVLNTVVLLSSSWFIARAVLATRAGRHQAAVRHLYAGGTLGVAFMAVKSYEWFVKINAGHTNSEMFFSFYYVITGVHLIHVLIGLIVLGVLVRELRTRRRSSLVESGAVYWHMVDLLWVVIFGLLYVMR
ncbi:cytochrome c oxidase subunit 3 [Mycolicibacterium goodii]|uniref:Probable cytochrome c oxidase subunit 3 n=1 Tax=Mycolicibacterium goodii TaxID=134601 RepID=A0ABS6HRD0_MYCGD|nr:cytochrome c oxidase subunit 3 [Mycolicibacterium goodii]MBU8807621.1 cytochrome c oxidase subunit 3 [Mycolicibacterium goodii]MBU8825256.1 cytochrome c oxidase subunit 3 [Mycolicibacterium goodii]MBU8828260.1 cytochrome c oxidase subunit 3 [Mycolicibacterium goodii]MBU8838262.1 cytochrome c oxidase subunit 3 [Mycolicibacterium goodii]